MSLNPWIAKGNEGYNPYIGVYAPLSFESKTNPEIRQPYVNGHYCYAAKAVIVINGLGVVGHISMFNQRFCQMHPEAIAKQTDDPDTDKEIGGSVALRHVLSDFFTALEEYHFSIFIADSACDSYGKYSMLKYEFGFSRVVILINARNSKFSSARFDAASLRSVLLPLKKFRYICVC